LWSNIGSGGSTSNSGGIVFIQTGVNAGSSVIIGTVSNTTTTINGTTNIGTGSTVNNTVSIGTTDRTTTNINGENININSNTLTNITGRYITVGTYSSVVSMFGSSISIADNGGDDNPGPVIIARGAFNPAPNVFIQGQSSQFSLMDIQRECNSISNVNIQSNCTGTQFLNMQVGQTAGSSNILMGTSGFTTTTINGTVNLPSNTFLNGTLLTTGGTSLSISNVQNTSSLGNVYIATYEIPGSSVNIGTLSNTSTTILGAVKIGNNFAATTTIDGPVNLSTTGFNTVNISSAKTGGGNFLTIGTLETTQINMRGVLYNLNSPAITVTGNVSFGNPSDVINISNTSTTGTVNIQAASTGASNVNIGTQGFGRVNLTGNVLINQLTSSKSNIGCLGDSPVVNIGTNTTGLSIVNIGASNVFIGQNTTTLVGTIILPENTFLAGTLLSNLGNSSTITTFGPIGTETLNIQNTPTTGTVNIQAASTGASNVNIGTQAFGITTMRGQITIQDLVTGNNITQNSNIQSNHRGTSRINPLVQQFNLQSNAFGNVNQIINIQNATNANIQSNSFTTQSCNIQSFNNGNVISTFTLGSFGTGTNNTSNILIGYGIVAPATGNVFIGSSTVSRTTIQGTLTVPATTTISGTTTLSGTTTISGGATLSGSTTTISSATTTFSGTATNITSPNTTVFGNVFIGNTTATSCVFIQQAFVPIIPTATRIVTVQSNATASNNFFLVQDRPFGNNITQNSNIQCFSNSTRNVITNTVNIQINPLSSNIIQTVNIQTGLFTGSNNTVNISTGQIGGTSNVNIATGVAGGVSNVIIGTNSNTTTTINGTLVYGNTTPILSNVVVASGGPARVLGVPLTSVVVLSGETNALVVSTTPAAWFRTPYPWRILGVRGSVYTPSTSGNITVDIRQVASGTIIPTSNTVGTSIFTNVLTIDANRPSSILSTNVSAITTTIPLSIADDTGLAFFITGAGTGAAGLKVVIYYAVS
jgi:hypothetical protein